MAGRLLRRLRVNTVFTCLLSWIWGHRVCVFYLATSNFIEDPKLDSFCTTVVTALSLHIFLKNDICKH